MFDSFWFKTVLRIITYKVCGTPFFSFKVTGEIVSVHAKNMGESGAALKIIRNSCKGWRFLVIFTLLPLCSP
jgi:hypothetical protein